MTFVPPSKTITFYFDPISPYVWLASKELGLMEAQGHAIVFQPVLLAGILSAHGSKGPAEIPAKRSAMVHDVMRLAARRGLPFQGPPGHPFNSLLALRMSLALDDQAERRRFALAMFAACWEGGQDLSTPAVLVDVANACGLDGAALLERAGDAEVKRGLIEVTERAIAQGVFGVPTFRVDGELFWGADRIDALLWHVAGNRIDAALLEDFLQRPALAQRKPG